MSTTQSDTRVLVQSVMQRGPLTVLSTAPVQTALETMSMNHISALPVVDDEDCLLGIVTLKDVVAAPLQNASVVVKDVMNGAPIAVKLDDTLQESAKLMVQHQIHHLPVVAEDKRVVGVISSVDFVRLTAEGLLKTAN